MKKSTDWNLIGFKKIKKKIKDPGTAVCELKARERFLLFEERVIIPFSFCEINR